MKRIFLISICVFAIRVTHAQITGDQYTIPQQCRMESPELARLNLRLLLNIERKQPRCFEVATIKPVAKRAIVRPQKSEINELKFKFDAICLKKIDLLFKHSFTTNQSLIILSVPIGRNGWPFGKA